MTGITTTIPQDGDGERILLARMGTVLANLNNVRNSGTLLISAARTASTTTQTITPLNCSGVVAYLNCTAASGTGGLVCRLEGFDAVSGNSIGLAQSTQAVVAVGYCAYVFGRGAGSLSQAGYPGIGKGCIVGLPGLPAIMRFSIAHLDGSSYTYSLGYELIP